MDLSDRMGGAVHLVFPDEKKGGRSQIGEKINLDGCEQRGGTLLC